MDFETENRIHLNFSNGVEAYFHHEDSCAGAGSKPCNHDHDVDFKVGESFEKLSSTSDELSKISKKAPKPRPERTETTEFGYFIFQQIGNKVCAMANAKNQQYWAVSTDDCNVQSFSSVHICEYYMRSVLFTKYPPKFGERYFIQMCETSKRGNIIQQIAGADVSITIGA